MSDHPPPHRFSPGRVASSALLVLVAAGVFVGIWLIPFPKVSTPPRHRVDARADQGDEGEDAAGGEGPGS